MISQVKKDFKISEMCIREHRSDPRRVTVIVHENWLQKLINECVIPEECPCPTGDLKCTHLLSHPNKVLQPWKLVLVQILPKQIGSVTAFHKFQHRTMDLDDEDLNYSHLIHYITETNFKNLWKDVSKKHNKIQNHDKREDIHHSRKQDFNDAIREYLLRMYSCPFICLTGQRKKLEEKMTKSFANHGNILPADIIVESEHSFYLFHPYLAYTLFDCVTFSSAIFSSSYCKPLFVIYQLLQAMRDLHDRGLFVGDLSLHEIFVNNNLWLYIQPRIWESLSREMKESNERYDGASNGHKKTNEIDYPGDEVETQTTKLNILLDDWLRGKISNFDYLMELNYMSGRRMDNPNHHPVIPWVMDFSSPFGGWRDLSKSKYRLTKGDKQLDMTYDSVPINDPDSMHIPHHVSDVLTDITYYVYMARRTPRSVLCQHVRPNWVPAEYPSSIQRMQEWTPDECVPEFYTDPKVFFSVHDDLPDLEFPSWAHDAKDFIDKHRRALESDHVSERLHMWIDLTFGYRLSGTAAIKAKNVCLNIVDQHTNLANCGINQLFTQPHPQKLMSAIWKYPPKLKRTWKEPRKKHLDDIDENHKEIEDVDTVDLGSRKQKSSRRNQPLMEQRFDPRIENQTIYLPKDYNPLAALNQLESTFNLSAKSIFRLPLQSDDQAISTPHVLNQRKVRDLISLGCIVVELFLPSHFRCIGCNTSLEDRYDFICKILKVDFYELPRCVRSVVKLLLQFPPAIDVDLVEGNKFPLPHRYPAVTDCGLPPPSAHQLLQPLVKLFPFPTYFKRLYIFLGKISGKLGSTNDDEMAEESVKTIAKDLTQLLPQITPEAIDIVIPYLQEIFDNEQTNVLAAWYLFNPLAQALGPQQTKKHLLTSLVPIYDMESFSPKWLKLFHRTYLLQLMVRLGLRTFLLHFATRLIEAIGGFKDYTTCDSLGNELSQPLRKTSHLHSPELEPLVQDTYETMLSPFDDESMPTKDLVTNVTGDTNPNQVEFEPEPEMFMFDPTTEDFNSPEIDLPDQLDQHLTESSDSGDTVSLGENNAVDDTSQNGTQTDVQSEVQIETDATSLGSPRHPSPTNTIPPTSNLTDERREKNDYNVSDVAMESVDWLCHRLGPVLTAKYLSRNLLRMLSLCYYGRDQLAFTDLTCQDSISICSKVTVGDKNVKKVLECLTNIAALYGEQIILLQYFPHVVELVSCCTKRITANLEAGLVGCLMLLKQIIPYVSDATLMDHLQDILIRDILYPMIQLISSPRLVFPNHGLARRVIAFKLLDVLHLIGFRIGFEMTRKHLTFVLQRFFASFDRVYGPSPNEANSSKTRVDNNSPTCSPPFLENKVKTQTFNEDAVAELKETFNSEMAYIAYIPFCKLAGDIHMENSLENDALLRHLCSQYDDRLVKAVKRVETVQSSSFRDTSFQDEECLVSGTFGKNVEVVGNRIDIRIDEEAVSDSTHLANSEGKLLDNTKCDINLFSKKMENTRRHLRGSWLAYWEHEIGQNEKDLPFNFKQIKLQTFTGHTGSVRAIYSLDNEISFVSGSKDKTAKLWSLRSHGDGSASSKCHWTYPYHKKSVFAVTFLESLRLVSSCDSTVHLWDPFMGSCVKQIESIRNSSVTVLTSMPAPSSVLVTGTSDANIRFLDARSFKYVHEYKVSVGPAGLIRCITVSPDGHWLAVGHSSGVISILDVRTGLIIATWKGHEGEILQIRACNKNTFVTSSLDQHVSVWNSDDGKLQCNMRGATEPIHCLQFYRNEMVSATTANRIGVHTSVDSQASYSSARLRVETFRGMISCLNILPLNRLLLLGADNGNICLLC